MSFIFKHRLLFHSFMMSLWCLRTLPREIQSMWTYTYWLPCNIAPEIISLHYSPPMNIKGQKTPPAAYSAWALNRPRGALSIPLDTRMGWDANVIVKWLVKLDWRMLGQEVQSTTEEETIYHLTTMLCLKTMAGLASSKHIKVHVIWK